MIRYYNFPQRSEKWYTYRKGRWTGSTAIDLLKGKKAPPENDGNFDNRHMLRLKLMRNILISLVKSNTLVSLLTQNILTPAIHQMVC